MSNIIHLQHAAKVYGGGDDLVVEVCTIGPEQASQWLRCNKNNRPVRRTHVNFLAQEILNGNWQLNGQAIVIADDEQVLDGQHRLMAIIEAGKEIKTLVVYGISPMAFRTIDTGAVRTGADALCLHFVDINQGTLRAVATAVQWCVALEKQSLNSKVKIGNTGIIEYVQKHMSMIQCADTIQSWPHDARPMSVGSGTALFEMFNRKKPELAQDFMRKLYTGEKLERTDVEYLLRATFIRDAQRSTKYPQQTKMRMVIKGWNWRRRGMDAASSNVITVYPNEDQKVLIL